MTPMVDHFLILIYLFVNFVSLKWECAIRCLLSEQVHESVRQPLSYLWITFDYRTVLHARHHNHVGHSNSAMSATQIWATTPFVPREDYMDRV